MLSYTTAFSQNDVIRVKSCENALISQQVDSLKKLYSADGFILMKEASITMESEFEMPVIVPLNQEAGTNLFSSGIILHVFMK